MNTRKEHILQNKTAAKRLFDITPFTLLDYPGKSACILWFTGCNMRCAYCYNPDIVLGKGRINYYQALEFIASRKHLLDAVVLSGGECMLHKGLVPLIEEIRLMGLLVKIDTNGSNPPILNILLKKKWVDYVALDFKAPAHKFSTITKSDHFNSFESSLSLLVRSGIDFEVRTTVHEALLNKKDMKEMVVFLEKNGYRGDYYIQYYRNNLRTMETLGNMIPKINYEALSTEKIRIKIRA